MRVFGRWPSFHDAEVLRVELDRGGAGASYGPTLRADVAVFEVTPGVGPDGTFVLAKQTVATFEFREVDELTLSGFNHQNVVWDLYIEDISAQQLERVKFRVRFPSTYGVEASFVCHAVAITDVRPFEPASDERAG